MVAYARAEQASRHSQCVSFGRQSLGFGTASAGADINFRCASARRSIRLGSIEVTPATRTITRDGTAIELGGRAFDLLVALLNGNGQIVSKEQLLRLVWPTVTVIDSNLKVQLSILRRALGAERWRVKTVSGRGYLIVMDEPQSALPPRPSIPDGGKLLISVDADPGIQDLVIRALSEVAEHLTGVARIALVSLEAGGDRHA